MQYIDLGKTTLFLLNSKGIWWDFKKKAFLTKLHKDLYLNENEMKSEEVVREFVKLVDYLEKHQEFGVNTLWASSSLNKSIYLNRKYELKKRFPLTVDSLSRFYDDSNIVNFYKMQGALSPTIIDLVGTTGAGKTTFCQQFVDNESKDLLNLTITDAGESTVIQTDILILENTEKKMFLKVRNKSEIMRDIFLVALEIDLSMTVSNIAERIKKSNEFRDRDIIDKVSNFYSTPDLVEKFINFSFDLQLDYNSTEEKSKWIQENLHNSDYQYILDDVLESESKRDFFYGYYIGFNLENDGEAKIISTIANTVFKNRKDEPEDYPEMSEVISKWLLYEHAILVLPCSDRAKEKVNYNFQEGLVFRDSRGHNLDEQSGIAADFEVKNKIFLIPIDSSGYLIDERYSSLFEKILISEPENNIFVLTKIDINATYKKYKKSGYANFKEFNREFTEKLAKTHNNILSKHLANESSIDKTTDFFKDETNLFINFMASFDNAYMSEIEDDTYESEAHKISYWGNALNEFDKSKVKIQYLESWFDIIKGIIRRNKLLYYENIVRKSSQNSKNRIQLIKECTSNIQVLVDYYLSYKRWQNEIDKQISFFKQDYRCYYQKASTWYTLNFISDNNTLSATDFIDLTAEIVRDVKSYVFKGTNINFYNEKLIKPLIEYLSVLYKNKYSNKDVIKNIAESIISNALEKAVKISYKAFDREMIDNDSIDILKLIYNDNTGSFIKPTVKTLKEVSLYTRPYTTFTEVIFCIYFGLFSKFKFNMEKYFIIMFATIVKNEIEELDKKIK